MMLEPKRLLAGRRDSILPPTGNQHVPDISENEIKISG